MTTRLPPIRSEKDWLQSGIDFLLLERLAGHISARKGRLLACASARLVWPLLTDERCRRAVDVAERFADGQAGADERVAAARAAAEVERPSAPESDLADSASFTLADDPSLTAWQNHKRNVGTIGNQSADTAHAVSSLECSDLIRHIFGNPFRPVTPPAAWPAMVTQLADAVYQGRDSAFALHDALQEAGHSELAEHFQKETAHPKGCWAVDLILGKQ